MVNQSYADQKSSPGSMASLGKLAINAAVGDIAADKVPCQSDSETPSDSEGLSADQLEVPTHLRK